MGPLQDPNSGFASNEDGYANSNIREYSRGSQSLRLAQFFLHR